MQTHNYLDVISFQYRIELYLSIEFIVMKSNLFIELNNKVTKRKKIEKLPLNYYMNERFSIFFYYQISTSIS